MIGWVKPFNLEFNSKYAEQFGMFTVVRTQKANCRLGTFDTETVTDSASNSSVTVTNCCWKSIMPVVNPIPSIKQRLSFEDCLEDKKADYHFSVLYCVTELCTIMCALI